MKPLDRYALELELAKLVRPVRETDPERYIDWQATALTAPVRVMREHPEAYRRWWEANRAALAAGGRMP